MNLMKLEMMNGTERIAEALQMRGLFATVKDDFIHITVENTKEDIVRVRRLLDDLNIPTFWQDTKFQVLVNRIPISIMKRIINKPGNEFPVSMKGYHYKWKSFVQRRFGIKVNGLDLDPQIAMLVKSLNLAGITALAGCSGHHRYEPNVQLSGVFQGAWFEVIQEKYLSECSLHYTWNVHYSNRSGSCMIAEKNNGTRFDMNLIYQDAVQMASVLQKHAEEIRQLKRNVLTRNKEMKAKAYKFLEKRDFRGLVEWMKGRVEKSTFAVNH
ncbi:hypothetical protein ACW2QC_13365 [Virgibacillus sp. FSP13]